MVTQHTEGPTLGVDVSPEIVGSLYVSGVGREGSCDKVSVIWVPRGTLCGDGGQYT